MSMIPAGIGTGVAPPNAISEWNTLVMGMIREVARLLDGTYNPLRIWLVNQLEQLVIDTPPTQLVPGGDLTREETLMYASLFQAVLIMLQTPRLAYIDINNSPVMMTPEMMLGYRRTQAPEGNVLGASLVPMISPATMALLASALPQSAPGRAAIDGATPAEN